MEKVIECKCKGCPKRTPSCHSTCESYLSFHRQRQKILKQQHLENISKAYSSENHYRILKRINKM